MSSEDRDRRPLGPHDPAAPAGRSSPTDLAAFLADAARAPRAAVGGRLIFALDATASRSPTWESAARLQAAMFEEAARVGGLSVQLVYYRGSGECRAGRWLADPRALADLMGRVTCAAGITQIGRVLAHAAAEAAERTVDALVFVGDALEEEPGELFDRAAALALRGVPVFLFQEGHDARVGEVFAEVARLTGGAHVPFDAGAAARLGALLRAVAAWAAGGATALAALADRPDGEGARLLLERMRD